MRPNVCTLKAAKVVKPPRMPTVRNWRVARLSRESGSARTKPMRAEPITLTTSAPRNRAGDASREQCGEPMSRDTAEAAAECDQEIRFHGRFLNGLGKIA